MSRSARVKGGPSVRKGVTREGACLKAVSNVLHNQIVEDLDRLLFCNVVLNKDLLLSLTYETRREALVRHCLAREGEDIREWVGSR
jgi:hypothetical protein